MLENIISRNESTHYGKNGGIPLRSGSYYSRRDGDGGEWIKHPVFNPDLIDVTRFGADDGLEPIEGGAPISVTNETGTRGEAIYTVKTAYTEITVDGEKDPAYDYGLHLKGALGSDEEYYKDRETCIEVYIIRGQDGRIYVYGEITDPDIVIDEKIMQWKPHYCDGLHPYYTWDNNNAYPSCVGLISADVECKYQRQMPKNCVAKRTEKGFKFEYVFDKMGRPMKSGDEMGFGFYYNDTNDFVDSEHYKRCIVKLPQRLNPEGSKYKPLDVTDISEFDAIRFSDISVTGKFAPEVIMGAERTGDMLRDIISGAATVNIVCGSGVPVHSMLRARYLAAYLNAGGSDALYIPECSRNALRKADYEILFDVCEGVKLANSLKYNEYGLQINEKCIEVAGRREDAMKMATELLISALEYVKNGGSMKELDNLYIGAFDQIPNAPEMKGLTHVTDAGRGAYLLLKQNAAACDFDEYEASLLASGYRRVSENIMASLRTAAYVSGDAMINLSYSPADGGLRAVVDPLISNGLPIYETGDYAPVCRSTFSQLAPRRIGLMTYAIKLDNGEFLVVDSGGNGGYKYLHDSLLELNGGRPVTVACWIFSHFHCDHIGGFLEMGDREELIKDFKIKCIIENFPQKQVRDTALNPGDQRNLERWPGVVDKTGATVLHARTGQKYRFGNAELEFIFTFEDLMPFDTIADRTNPTSSVFAMTLEGQRYIITGDACHEATELMAKRFGNWLKSDFVQLPHHGWGDGGTDRRFYEYAEAKWILYPGSMYSPAASEKWAIEHCDEYFLNPDSITTLELPYKCCENA